MHHYALDALDRDLITQMAQKQRLQRHLAHDARLARGHLADDGGEDRIAAMGDRGHLHRHIEIFERHIAGALAKGAFRLKQFRADEAFDHDLGVGGHEEVDGLGLHHLDGLPRQRACNRRFIEINRQALRASIATDRRRADDNGDRHGLTHGLIFEPVLIAAGAADARGHAHAKAVCALQRRPVGRHIGDAILWVLRDAKRRRQSRRGVKTRGRDRNWQKRKTAARFRQVGAGDDDLLTHALLHHDRRNGFGDGVNPRLTDF